MTVLPIVVFSGSDDPQEQNRALGSGANAYEVKPQGYENFVRVIKRIGESWLFRGDFISKETGV